MRRERGANEASSPSRVRRALEALFFRDDGQTIIEECRRCGTTLEAGGPNCPTCGRSDIARYRIE